MKLAIYGTSGGGKEASLTVDAIQKRFHRYEELLYIDDTKPEGLFRGCPRMSFQRFCELYSPADVCVHVAMGELNNKRIVNHKVTDAGYRLETLIHPDARIGDDVRIGPGVQIKMGVTIGSGVTIGEGTWVQAYATIQDHTTIGEFCQISAKSFVGRNVTIHDLVMVAMHSVVLDNLTLDSYSIVSMGSTAVTDLQYEDICVGNPGRVMMKNQKHSVY